MHGLLSGEEGNVTILAGICLPVLAIAMGLAVDHSTLLHANDDLQNTADTAALAGARAMGASEDEAEGYREKLAIDRATDFITSRNSVAAFSITPSAAKATVEVSISTDQAVAFGGLFGQSQRKVSAESTATYMANRPSGCLIALDESASSGIYMQGAAKVSAPGCGVWSNATGASSIHMRGSPSLRGKEVCAEGASGNAVSRIYPELTTDCGKATDPYAGRLDGIPTSCDHTDFAFEKKAKEAELEPGVYCGGLEIKGLEVSLKPGLYVIKNGPLVITSNASVVGYGVSIVLTGEDAALDMQGSPDVTLTAMTTGELAGIALAVTDSGKEAESEMQGSPKLTVTGSIYMPDQRFGLQGNPQLTVKGDQSKVVAGSFSLKGSPDINIEAQDTETSVTDISFLRLVR